MQHYFGLDGRELLLLLGWFVKAKGLGLAMDRLTVTCLFVEVTCICGLRFLPRVRVSRDGAIQLPKPTSVTTPGTTTEQQPQDTNQIKPWHVQCLT